MDLTSNIAAPFASAVLADLGAHVTHYEPLQGDDSRRMSPTDGNESAYFRVVNRHKSFASIDLTQKLRTITDALETADVFVTNMRPRKLEQLGLDETTLSAKYPRLITAYLSAYGDHTSERNAAGYDGVIQGRTGIISVTGDREPARAGVSVLDIGAGTWLALGVITALYQRERTGRGQAVATSLMETGVSWTSYHQVAHQMTGEPSTRSGTGHPAFAPYGVFNTQDGHILIGVGGDEVFQRLVMALDLAGIAQDPRFATNSARVRNRDALTAELNNALSKLSGLNAIHTLREADVPVDIVQPPEALLDDPAAQAQLDQSGNGHSDPRTLRIASLPLRFNGQYPNPTRD